MFSALTVMENEMNSLNISEKENKQMILLVFSFFIHIRIFD